jgi:hypothetical protein
MKNSIDIAILVSSKIIINERTRDMRNSPMPAPSGARLRNQLYDESNNELTKEVRIIGG